MLYNLIAGSLLAFVYIKTDKIIKDHKKEAAGDNVAEVLPDITGGFVQQGEGSEFPYWIGYTDTGLKKPGGYVFIAQEDGYSSTIETIIGVDINGTITGVKILFQQETPGLGDKIEEIRSGESVPWFLHQFVGKPASYNFNVTQDGGNIDAVSGATISSRTVAKSVIKGLKKLLEVTGGEAFAQKVELTEIAPVPDQDEDDIMGQLMNQLDEEADEEPEDDIMEQLMDQDEE